MYQFRFHRLNLHCKYCGGKVPHWGDSCTVCGRVAHPPHRLRIWGAVHLISGLAISGAMGYLMVVIGQIIRHSQDPRATIRFSGGPLEIVILYGVLSLPLLVGFTLIAAGLWQLRYGRRHPNRVRVAFIWYFLLLGGALAMQFWEYARATLPL
jgi:hypothetical protein